MCTICSSLCIVFHRFARSVSIAALSISSSSLPLPRLLEDLRDVRLGAAIFVEIAVDPIAERNDPEELPGLRGFLRVQGFHCPAKLGQVGADAGILVDRLHRPVEEAVRSACSFGNLLAAHGRQLIDLLAEFRAVGVERGKLIDELRYALIEFGSLLGLQRDQTGSLRDRDSLQRFGGIELQLRRGRGLRCRSVAIQSILSVPLARQAATVNGSPSRARSFQLYYRCNTEPCKEAEGSRHA